MKTRLVEMFVELIFLNSALVSLVVMDDFVFRFCDALTVAAEPSSRAVLLKCTDAVHFLKMV